MPDISTYLYVIENALRGEDVRDAFIEALQTMTGAMTPPSTDD